MTSQNRGRWAAGGNSKTHSIEDLDENEALVLPHPQKLIFSVIEHRVEHFDMLL